MPDVTSPTVQNLAGEALSYFVTKHRDNGEAFWCLSDNRADWVHGLAMNAHGDMMPEDWRYKFIVDVLNALDDGDTDAPEPSIYTHELTGWLHSRADRYAYVDEAVSEMGGFSGLVEALQAGQAAEIREVFESVLDALETRAEELSDEESEAV